MHIMTGLFVRAALVPALLLTPYLLQRLLLPVADLMTAATATGAAAVLLSLLVPVSLHLAGVPVTPESLAAVHWSLLLAVSLAARFRHLHLRADDHASCRRLLPVALLFALLILPWTHLAGIDTYKWQGLATNVRVEQNVPWLIHPLSLFGYTPRAYPSAQPLMLASIQILGGLGVKGGFFVFSLFSGLLGICATALLGRRLFGTADRAAWLAFLYACSPVFMRYHHWATGRGLFLAILPLFVLALLDLPRSRAFGQAALAGLLLGLSHKTGLVAVLLLSASLPLCALLPWTSRSLRLIVAGIGAALAVLLAPPLALPGPAGSLTGFIYKAVTRFGWLLPMAAVGLALAPPDDRSRRRLFPAALLTLPFVALPDMYGAMLALPFITVAAADGFLGLRRHLSRASRVLTVAAVILTLAAAVTIVTRRSLSATPARVRRAADFLELHDPRGPYVIDAPGRARAQFHAYVSGCPRFNLHPPKYARIAVRTPPPPQPSLRATADAWIRYARTFLTVPDIDVDWYGRNPRTYAVIIDGHRKAPPGTVRIYSSGGVEIYAPRNQKVQREHSP